MCNVDRVRTAGTLALMLSVSCAHPSLAPPPRAPAVTAPRTEANGPADAQQPEPPRAESRPPVAPEPPWKQLPSGARLLIVPDRLVGTVAVQLWVRGGVASEPEGALGLSHLCERLLLHEVAAPASQNVRTVGGEVSGYTTLDHTVFQLVVPKGKQELALEVLRAILMPQGLDDAMLHRQREQATLELTRSGLGARGLAVEKLRELSFPGHPYGRPLLGQRHKLAALQLRDVESFLTQGYHPERLTVVMSGAVSDALAQPLTALLSGLPRRDVTEQPVAEPSPLSKPQVIVSSHEDPTGQAVIAVALPGTSASSADAVALELWAELLRGSLRLRSSGGRPGGDIAALSFAGQRAGLLLLEATTQPSQVEEATQRLLGELLRLSHRPIDAGELARAKQRLLGEQARQLDLPSGRAQRAGFFASLGLPDDRYEQTVKELGEAALRKTMGRYLRRDALAVLWLLPRSRAPKEEATQLERSRQRLLSQLPQAFPVSVPSQSGPQLGKDGVWRHQVPGGPLVLLMPDHGVKVVAAAASWPGGLRLEDEQTAGSHALWARLWQHTPRGRGGAALGEALLQLRGSTRAQIDLDAFTVAGEWPSLADEEALPLFLDGLNQNEPSEAELERERRQLVAEVRSQDEGIQPSLRNLKTQLFGSHPYKLEPSLQSLSGLSRKRLLELWRRAYSPAQMTLAIVGDFEPSQVLAVIESRIPTSGHSAAHAMPQLPTMETPKQLLSYHGKDQALLAVGFRVPSLRSPDQAALELLSEVLLGDGGRLSRELVDRRGLLLKLEGKLLRGLSGGALYAWAVTTPTSLDSAEASLRDELRRIVDHPLSDEELETAKQRLVGRSSIHRQRRDEVALELAQRTALGLPSSDQHEQQLQSLTAGQVQDVAKRYLDERHAILQAVLPQAQLAVKHSDAQDKQPKLVAKLSGQPASKSSATVSSKSSSQRSVGKSSSKNGKKGSLSATARHKGSRR